MIMTQLSAGISNLLNSVPPAIAVMIFSLIPVFEIRGSLPIARFQYNLSWSQAILWAVVGNIIGLILVMVFLQFIYETAIKFSPALKHFFDWLFSHTRAKFASRYERFGPLCLLIFTAVPLPFFGAYTGAVAAFVLGIPFKKAFVYLVIGILLAAAIISLILP